MSLKKVHIEYFAMYLLIGVSGSPFFYLNGTGTLVSFFVSLILLVLGITYGWIVLSKKSMTYIGIALAIIIIATLLQFLGCGFFPYRYLNKFLTRFLFGFFVLCIVKENFFKRYINVIAALGLIGLFFHITTLLMPSFFDFLIHKVVPLIPNQFDKAKQQIWHNQHIIIFDFWQHDLFRNSGAFWEPGANAGFTLLAMFFNMFVYNKKLTDKKNLLFIVVVISTLSTAGFIALMFLLFINPQFRTKILLKTFSFICFFLIAQYIITNVDFLGAKLINQLNNFSEGNAHTSRFASARLDFETFQKYPFGFSALDLREGIRDEDDFRTNGVFILLSNYGIILFIFYYIFSYIGIKRAFNYLNSSSHPSLDSIYLVAFIILMSLSENYFERPVFMCFAMLIAFFPRKKRLLSDESFPPLMGKTSKKLKAI
jgi:hypothetical protein